MSTPTEEAYTEFQHAYDFFNARLFEGTLPPCLITMQRRPRTFGYFSGQRWNNVAGAVTDEIAMNPVHFATRSVEEILSTLAHEMAHLWQHHFGKKPSRSYHDKQWAFKMDALGLCPSSTGEPGGKRTGQHVSHYVVEGGPFQRACAVLLAEGFVISWQDRKQEANTSTKAGVRIKYTCPSCQVNAWAKSEVVLLCGACEGMAMEPEDATT